MKRYLDELNREELIKVLDNNDRLRGKLAEYTNESASLFLDDQLHYLKDSISIYSICPYTYSYLDIKKPDVFLDNMLTLESNMPVLSDKDTYLLTRAVDTLNKLETTDEQLTDTFHEQVHELRDKVLENMIKQLEYADSRDALLDYFLEVYVYENGNKDYIEDDYTLKRDITISYR